MSNPEHTPAELLAAAIADPGRAERLISLAERMSEANVPSYSELLLALRRLHAYITTPPNYDPRDFASGDVDAVLQAGSLIARCDAFTERARNERKGGAS